MRLYTIRIAPIAKKQIEALPDNIRSKVITVLAEVLAKNPFIGKALKAELKGLYSYRIGDYRIIYDVVRHELLIQVIKVMHRREAYR